MRFLVTNVKPIETRFADHLGSHLKMASSALDRVASFAFYSRILVVFLQVNN